MSRIFFAAFSSEPLPVRWRASCSFTVSMSTRAITFIKSSRVVLIHRSIVSSTVNFGFCIWSSTCACSAGAMFSRHRNGLVRYASGITGLKSANTLRSVQFVRRLFMLSSYTPLQWNVLPFSRCKPCTSTPARSKISK